MPNSVSTSGRSPARLCSRERYCRNSGSRVQVDVEREEIGEVGLEIFGGRIVGVADQRGGLHLLDQADQLTQEPGDARSAVPADDVRRDLVADQERADGRVIAAGLDHVRDGAADRIGDLLRVEKADVLRPRDSDEDPEVSLCGQVEEPAGRRGEEPEAVGPQLGHQGEVPRDDLRGGISITIRVRSERAVGDPPERNLVISSEEELPANFQPSAGAGGLRAPYGARPRVEPHGPYPPPTPLAGAHSCSGFETLGGCARSDIQEAGERFHAERQVRRCLKRQAFSTAKSSQPACQNASWSAGRYFIRSRDFSASPDPENVAGQAKGRSLLRFYTTET